jgi:60 kDa SS-A/Ro ribonucleoprotein
MYYHHDHAMQDQATEKEAVMKFNFIGRGKTSDNRNYTLVRSGLPDAQWDLYTALLSAWLQGSLQERAGDVWTPLWQEAGDDRAPLRQLVRDSDPEFVSRLAVYLQEEKELKALSFWLSAELAALYGNDERIGNLVLRLIQQPGEIPEWLDFYTRAANAREAVPKKGQKPGRAIRKALDTCFNRMGEYPFGRYSRDLQVRLKEALQLLRPKSAGRTQKALFGKILRDQFPARSTWEQEWQALYQQPYESQEQRQVILRDKWKEGISSFRIGYNALLGNLQPMLCSGVSGKVLKLAAEYLGNAVAVGKSGLSPLRLLEVYRALRHMEQGGTGMLSEALEQAALHSAWNRTDLDKNRTWVIAMDVSNSMKHPVSGYSGVYRFDLAPLLAMILQSRGEQVITGIIGNTWKPIDLPLRPILGGTDQFRLREGEAGYAINAHLVLQDLLRKGQVVDKILLFTDCRLWDNRPFNQPAGTDLGSVWRSYRKIAPQAKLYLFDLAGYGVPPLQWREEDVFLVAGWHDRIFDGLQLLEQGKEALELINNAG